MSAYLTYKHEFVSIVDEFKKDKVYSELIVEEYDTYIISDLHEFINSTPLNGDFKVIICRNFELCSVILQNKLLKDIEQLSDNTLLILDVENINKVISTILSRVIVLSNGEIINYSKYETKYADFFKKLNLDLTEINFFIENKNLLKYLHIFDTSKLFIEYYIQKWDQIFCNIIIKNLMYYYYTVNDFSKIIIINNYEKRLALNSKYELQFSAMLIELNQEVKSGSRN